ncbi:hypothetical protein METBIDRAFT_147240 [Metschnikowia bicuspidata var. bicuspidata NRRL YB-4993]|uniref:Uncharacterized protein n=1 Tax=Metschnikowia bicuspidata var. bicuspidata NRRL YB-4993 TaxID=869754 RepID=A0A1A0HE15_9ASCO|nr:hypothetical protein METBIDRAFT_147240 [Metschnikowia bicuspidata var. bicuspidata NRRL YB-4993]OBA22142.1 hypothetical protein METBIDRAFT_147240 [Metschnikowia bicuspidata var. bicuspidata NRRL YB-4993]
MGASVHTTPLWGQHGILPQQLSWHGPTDKNRTSHAWLRHVRAAPRCRICRRTPANVGRQELISGPHDDVTAAGFANPRPEDKQANVIPNPCLHPQGHVWPCSFWHGTGCRWSRLVRTEGAFSGELPRRPPQMHWQGRRAFCHRCSVWGFQEYSSGAKSQAPHQGGLSGLSN